LPLPVWKVWSSLWEIALHSRRFGQWSASRALNHEFNGFEIFAVGRLGLQFPAVDPDCCVAERAAELKDCIIGAGPIVDALIYVTLFRCGIFKSSSAIKRAQEHGDGRDCFFSFRFREVHVRLVLTAHECVRSLSVLL